MRDTINPYASSLPGDYDRYTSFGDPRNYIQASKLAPVVIQKF